MATLSHILPSNSLNQPSERTASNIMKGIVVVLGVIVALLALVVERLGSVYQLALSLSSVTAGGILGIFAMGMLCRQANSKVMSFFPLA